MGMEDSPAISLCCCNYFYLLSDICWGLNEIERCRTAPLNELVSKAQFHGKSVRVSVCGEVIHKKSPILQMNMTEMGAKLSLVKKTIAIVLALLFLAPATGVAASDKFSDSQTTLSYSVYKPSNTLGLRTTKFSLLPCQPLFA